MAQIRIREGRTTIVDLEVDDPAVARLIADVPLDDRPDLIRRCLSIGARGIVSMGLGISVDNVTTEVRGLLDSTIAETEARVSQLIAAAQHAMGEQLNPDHRSSHIAKALVEIERLHDKLLTGLDPQRRDSHTGQVIGVLGDMLGPEGLLSSRLRDALQAEESGVATMAAAMERGFLELRELISRESGRMDEAQRGTAKGVEFEDEIEVFLRRTAKSMAGCVVERTGTTVGNVDASCKTGDFVIASNSGCRVVVEAKNTARISLAGSGGILAELDRAMANRQAESAVCVASTDAFPNEVGTFAVYGNRVLVVDDGDGVLLDAALRFAMELAGSMRQSGAERVDIGTLEAAADRIKAIAHRVSSTKRALTSVKSSIDGVRDELDRLRNDLLDAVSDVMAELGTRREDRHRSGPRSELVA